MSQLFRFSYLICAVLGLIYLQGCATLSKSECLTADWEIIGLEDGSAGRPTSYIGNHRSACADYGVKPDLDTYLKGHKKGVTQYCTYQTGFNLGERGSSYNKVCPESQYPDFLRGYQRGSKAYQLQTEVRQLRGEFDGLINRLTEIETLIKEKEDIIVLDATPTAQRKALLEEVKLLNAEAAAIKLELPGLEEALYQAERRYEQFMGRK